MQSHRSGLALSLVAALAVGACSKEDKIENAIEDAFEDNGSVASALCGFPVDGLDEVTVTSLALGSSNTGTASVSGKPLRSGTPPAAQCSGTISFDYGQIRTARKARRKARSTRYTVFNIKITSSAAVPKSSG